MTFGAHKFVRSEPFLDYLYELFLTAISRKLWRHLAAKLELSSAAEREITSEKRWKKNRNRPINSDTIAVQSISPWANY